MFKSVLIAEDHESASISVRKTLADLGVAHADYVYYCDQALQRIRKNAQSHQPIELLITDLYFEEDHNQQQINGGVQLIKTAKQAQPNLKVLVFSAEPKAAVIDMLFNELGINGYVRKARHDAQELKLAIENIYRNRQHFPAHLRQAVKQKNAYQFTDFDITIISLLSNGMLQKDIPSYLQKNNIKPSGLSSLEKRLNHIKETLEFSKNEQLVAFCKDMGII
ncbi:response regulator [Mucilaginibacter calamicampi]|uniref:Response regulator n=1 Tax=Mucilaginibacter calamicampi TaxID=1302352 RepID=A0ABW2YT91_9SPHI